MDKNIVLIFVVLIITWLFAGGIRTYMSDTLRLINFTLKVLKYKLQI